MDNAVFLEFCTLLENAMEEKATIYATFSSKNNSGRMSLVPHEYNYQGGSLYIESFDDNNIKINKIDEIYYNEMEEIYTIVSEDMTYHISM